jgi:hypothetical protein
VARRVRVHVLVENIEDGDERPGRIERLERVAASTPELRERVKAATPGVMAALSALAAILMTTSKVA